MLVPFLDVLTRWTDVRTHAPLIFTFPPPLDSSASADALTLDPEFVAAEFAQIDLDRIHDAGYDHDRRSILSARFTPPSRRRVQESNIASSRCDIITTDRFDNDMESIVGPEFGNSDADSVLTGHFDSDRESILTAKFGNDRDSIMTARYDNDTDSVMTGRFSTYADSVFTGRFSYDEYSLQQSQSPQPSSPSPPLRATTPYQPGPLGMNSIGTEWSFQTAESEQVESSLFTLPSTGISSAPARLTTFPAGVSHPDGGHYISAKQLMAGSSDYVVVDKSRISAFSPRGNSRASGNGHFNTSPQPGGNGSLARLRTVQQVNMLPNQNIEMDLRTLNLHLHARVAEILACAEAMWEWVQAFQHREQDKARGRVVAETRKPDETGATMYPPIGDVSQRLGPDVKRELLGMNRERFDELLAWFRLCVPFHDASPS
jgi:hypothetical protein